jgi:hypothetical protein
MFEALCHSRKVAGSIPDEVAGFSILRNPSSHNVTLKLLSM